MAAVIPYKPYLLREFGQGDDAWQLVRAGSTIVSHRPEKIPSGVPGEPDRIVWLDTVSVVLAFQVVE